MVHTVSRSSDINTLEQARQYYLARLAGQHNLECKGRPVTVHFERGATHLFSEKIKGTPLGAQIVRRRISPWKTEEREFSLDRARLMDHVIPTIRNYTVSISGTGAHGREKIMLHGSQLPDGRYMRVVLRPGPGSDLTCVSAYAVSLASWQQAHGSKRAKFPP